MFYDRKYISLNSKNELLALKPVALTTVADDTAVLTDNQVCYVTNEKALRVKKDNAVTISFLDQFLGTLQVGDMIRIQAEYYNISGAKPFEALIKGDLAGTYANVDFVQSVKSSEWETLNLNWVVQEDNTYTIRLGLSASQAASEYKIRDVRVEVLSRASTAKQYRTAFLRKVSGTFIADTAYAYDACTITQGADNLKIVFGTPLAKKGLGFTNQPYYTVLNNYIARVAYTSTDTVYITFFPTDDGTSAALAISTLPDNADVAVMLMG